MARTRQSQADPRPRILRTRFRRARCLSVGLTTLWGILLGTAHVPVAAGEPDAEQLRFFETAVRPLLAESCFKCHGPSKQSGGLRLDTKAGVLAGGETGPALVPGHPEESLLVEAVEYDGLEMPPKTQLSEEKRQILARWVAMGAPWPDGDEDASPALAGQFSDEDRSFWSFQPLKEPEVPAVADGGWSRNEIDRFIFARLATEGLEPAPEADRATLIRRLSFDLHGLPPAPEDVEAFLNDDRPEAYGELVDRMLESPRYGERWGRHWLDLVRYADSDGYNQDAERPNAWRYRDYVIDAFNADKPYDRFVAEQIAGDEVDPDSAELRVAVGYLRLGTYEYNQRNVPGQWETIVNDITDVTGDVFMGMGLACARCHDHKFDPLLQKDYYRLRAFFEGALPRDDLDLATDTQRWGYGDRLAAWQDRTAELRAKIARLEQPYRIKATTDAIIKFPEDIQALILKPRAERTPAEHMLASLAYRQVSYEQEDERFFPVMKRSKDKDAWEALQKELSAYSDLEPKPLPRVMSVTEVGPEAPPTIIPGDGTGETIEPGFLSLLHPEPATIQPPESNRQTTGRRLALARWMTQPENRLTTRVMVNRIWQYHFGRGIVGTSSDFGRKGDRPSHPDLLDWLAVEFPRRGWSVKAMHRLILNSSTYRQSAAHPSPDHGRTIDPENRLLWRGSTRRLEVEPIRDALLFASGELDLTAGGPAVAATQPRRMIYTKILRNKRDPLSDSFDAPDSSTTTPQRNTSVTALQALLMINGTWTLERAGAFARRLAAASQSGVGQVDLGYRLAYGRPPSPEERAEALAFLDLQARRAGPGDPLAALTDFCHALLNSNEFLYVD